MATTIHHLAVLAVCALMTAALGAWPLLAIAVLPCALGLGLAGAARRRVPHAPPDRR